MAQRQYDLTPTSRLIAERQGTGIEWQVWYQDDRGMRVPENGGYSCHDPDAFAANWEARLRAIHERRRAPNEGFVMLGALCVGGLASVVFCPATLIVLAWLLTHL